MARAQQAQARRDREFIERKKEKLAELLGGGESIVVEERYAFTHPGSYGILPPTFFTVLVVREDGGAGERGVTIYLAIPAVISLSNPIPPAGVDPLVICFR